MNDKEKELWRVIDNVIKCCAIELPDGKLSITREDVLGKSRAENLVMARWGIYRIIVKERFWLFSFCFLIKHKSALRPCLEGSLVLLQVDKLETY